MLIRYIFLKAVKAAAFASAVCGLILSGCGEKSGTTWIDDGGDDTPTVSAEFAGDWLVYNGDNKKGYITLSPSGELSEGVFRKAGNFWIEGLYEGTAGWKVSRASREFYVTSSVWSDTLRYELSGDVFTTTACYDNGSRNPVCRATELRRTNLAALRSSLGTVQTNDRNLYMSTAHRDLMWYLQGNVNEVIDFDAVYFNKDGERYPGSFRDGMWYTSGSSLFLLNVAYNCGDRDDDCEAAVISRVELGYSVTVNGGAPVRLTLSGAGASDVWLPASYDERTGNGAAKSRQGAGAGKRALSPLAVLTGR
jgi:hypothetical protein